MLCIVSSKYLNGTEIRVFRTDGWATHLQRDEGSRHENIYNLKPSTLYLPLGLAPSQVINRPFIFRFLEAKRQEYCCIWSKC